MKHIVLIVLLQWACQAYAQKILIDNESSPASKKGYYNWKVYVVAEPVVLKTIREVVYTLHPTFKYPVQTVPKTGISLTALLVGVSLTSR
jgi:transcription initiation factor IIF auxiliary subunit